MFYLPAGTASIIVVYLGLNSGIFITRWQTQGLYARNFTVRQKVCAYCMEFWHWTEYTPVCIRLL